MSSLLSPLFLWQPIRNSCCKDTAGDSSSRGILEKLKDCQMWKVPTSTGQGQSRVAHDRLLPAHLCEGKGAELAQQFLVTYCTHNAWADGPWDFTGLNSNLILLRRGIVKLREQSGSLVTKHWLWQPQRPGEQEQRGIPHQEYGSAGLGQPNGTAPLHSHRRWARKEIPADL